MQSSSLKPSKMLWFHTLKLAHSHFVKISILRPVGAFLFFFSFFPLMFLFT